MLVQVVVDVRIESLCHRQGLVECGMRLEDVLEQLSGGGLATFCHPVLGNQDIAIRSPHTVDKDGLLGHGEMTCRGSSYGGKTSKCVGHVVLVVGVAGVEVVVTETDLCADGTDPASVGVNDTSADSDASRESQIRSGLFGEGADALTGRGVLAVLVRELAHVIGMQSRSRLYHPVYASHALEVVFGQVLQTNLFQKVILPALDTAIDTDRDKTLLAHDTAVAAGFAASGNVGESIRQIVKLAAVEQLLWHVVLEPQDFWDLHLNAHLTANVAEEVVVGGINLLRLLFGTVIEPEDDIAVIAILIVEFGAGDRDRLVGVIGEDCERASSVEANAANRRLVDVVLVQSALDRLADAVPDVCGRLFLFRVSLSCLTIPDRVKSPRAKLRVRSMSCTYIVASLRLPQANVLARESDNVTLCVHDTSTSAASSDIDTDVVIGVRADLIVGINRHLPGLLAGLLPVRLAVWKVLHDGQTFYVYVYVFVWVCAGKEDELFR